MESPFGLTIDGLSEAPFVASFDGKETMSRCYSFSLVVHTPAAGARAFEAAVHDRAAELLLSTTSPNARRIAGIVDRTEHLGVREQDRHVFRLRLVPRLARLERRRTSRIFQDMTTAGVVDDVLGGHRIPRRFSLTRKLPKRAYCVQHRETDLAFVTRLLAEEGLFFFFEDPTEPGRPETLVIGDDVPSYSDIAGDPTLQLREGSESAALRREEHQLRSVSFQRTLRPGAALVRDHDYQRPRTRIHSAATGPKELPTADPGVTAIDPVPALRERNDLVYEHQGDYEDVDVERPGAKLLLEQLRSRTALLRADGICQRLAPGHRFILADHDLAADCPQWVVASVRHRGRAAGATGPQAAPSPGATTPTGAEGLGQYQSLFSAAPARTPLRPKPPRRAPHLGPETAVVVGPSGQEVYTDELGRIKVQFHWDLFGERNERSSCWIRVAQAWAGEGFGAVFLPRIGMEVLVTFLGGDPDRPVVTGCLYNPVAPPPFKLPDSQVTSGLKTRSSPGGGGHHELTFNDARGAEVIRLRSERDLELVAKNDLQVSTGADRVARVRGADSLDVSGDRRTEVAGDHSETVRGARETTVLGMEKVTVAESRFTTVAGFDNVFAEGGAALTARSYILTVLNDLSVIVGSGGSNAQLSVAGSASAAASKSITVSSDDRITLRVADSAVEIGPDGITLSAPAITLKSKSITALGDGPRLTLGEEVELVSKKISMYSEKARIELDQEAKIKGDKVQLGKEPTDKSKDEDDPEKKTKPFKIQLTDAELEPYAGKRYALLAAGARLEGETTAGGNIEVDVPEEATSVDVTAWIDEYPTGRRRTWQIKLAELPPASDPQGAQIRLASLGYYSGAPGPEWTVEAKSALAWFQKDHELEDTGELDAATAAELEKVHGG